MKDMKLIVSGGMWILSAAGGFLVPFVLYPIGEVTGDACPWWLPLIALPVCIGLLCFVLARATPRLPWLCPILTFCAIPFGIVAYAMLDTTDGHTLLGIEVFIVLVLAFPGVVVGGPMGIFVSRRAGRRATAPQSDPPLPRAHNERSKGETDVRAPVVAA